MALSARPLVARLLRTARACLLASATLSCAIAEERASNVVDPYGLGERLALIAYLQDRHVEVPDAASLHQLRSLYTGYLDRDYDEKRRDSAERVRVLRQALVERFGVQAPADATADDLIALQRENEARVAVETEVALRKDRGQAASVDGAKSAVKPPATAEPSKPQEARGGRRADQARRSATPASATASANAPTTTAEEPDFASEGCVLSALEKFVHLYLKVDEGASDTVTVSLWNGNDTERLVKFRVTYATGGKPTHDERTVGAHCRMDIRLKFSHSAGGRADGVIVSVDP